MQAILRHLLEPPASARAPATLLYDAAEAAATAAVEAAERCTDPDLQPHMAAAAARAVAPVEGFSVEVRSHCAARKALCLCFHFQAYKNYGVCCSSR